MIGTDAAAEAALEAALGDITDTAVEGEVLAGQPPVPAGGGGVDCTEAEARELVARARESIAVLDSTMEEIVRRRVWLALGYPDPRTFWVQEFTESSGLSRTHVYRTARVLSLLYGLVERLGDDAAAVAITERSLRAIPANGGAGDAALIDAIAGGVEALGDDATAADIQQVVDGKLAAARKAATRPDAPPVDVDELAARLSQLGVDTSALTAASPATDGEANGDGAWHSHDGGEPHRHDDTDGWGNAAAPNGVSVVDDSRSGVTITNAPTPAGGVAGGESAINLVTLRRATAMIAAVHPTLAAALDAASDDDLATLKGAVPALRAAADMIEAAESPDDLLEMDSDL